MPVIVLTIYFRGPGWLKLILVNVSEVALNVDRVLSRPRVHCSILRVRLAPKIVAHGGL